jgi:hypothetical protein
MPLNSLTDLMAFKQELGQSSNQKKPLIFGKIRRTMSSMFEIGRIC